jgi:hypothetical protein
LREIRKKVIESALAETDGNKLKAAKILGINRNTLSSKINKFKIKINQFKIVQYLDRKNLMWYLQMNKEVLIFRQGSLLKGGRRLFFVLKLGA